VPAQASALLLPAYCLTLLTDNTLNYASEFGVIVFGLAGITLATVRQRVADERNAPVMQEPNPLVSAS
jgi:hypothetical protein